MRFNQPWVNPLLLLLLGSVSVLFGVMQMSLLGQGEAGMQNEMATAHYFSMPIPIVIHILTGCLFNLLMPLQFFKLFRARFPVAHRYIGRGLVVCILAFGLSGLWMNHLYPQYGGVAKYTGIVAMCAVLIISMALAVIAIRRGDVTAHRIWMMRATAAALSPATQRIIILPAFAVFGQSVMTDWIIGGLIWLGLIINLLFVERLVYKERQLTEPDLVAT
ncbi:DUF2306 domain-containing protein [Alteromonadaceae bacterium BrNp21-10]|nr:DUF2306 domain-containing protein [Alteromonadaceae bacterium BrNp21-10]